jgi:hypothetical protein
MSELCVFLDADTEPKPDFLMRLLACHSQLGGLVSVQPYHRTEKAYEQLSLLFNLVGLLAVPLGANCGVAFGPAMVTSRKDYERSGAMPQSPGRLWKTGFLPIATKTSASRLAPSSVTVKSAIGCIPAD